MEGISTRLEEQQKKSIMAAVLGKNAILLNKLFSISVFVHLVTSVDGAAPRPAPQPLLHLHLHTQLVLLLLGLSSPGGPALQGRGGRHG